MKNTHLSLLLIFSLSLKAQNQPTIENDSIFPLDEVIIKGNTILGNKFVAKNRTGAAYYLSSEELGQFDYADINRALNKIPGINVFEEDGFGLRPNISIRGTSPERSAKIAIMEDGVLISPAPYSASSAYYFPSVARMQAIEVLKGSSQIQYGPYTTGGALNFVSTEIPESFGGKVAANYGSFQAGQLHANIGDTVKTFGYLVEYLNVNSNGFKSLANNLNTGFDINEITSKIRYNTPNHHKRKQSFQFKFHYYDEVSNETYLGLTASDFEKTPYVRYQASAKDKMTAEHMQYVFTHEINFSEQFKVSSNVYLNGFKKNWYKLDDVLF